jgi:cytochrome c551/c552
LNADKALLVKILLHGLSGQLDGKEYPSQMPALGANSDDWVASVVNYVRYEFGNASRRFRRPGDTTSPFITAPEVALLRKQYASRTASWTLTELESTDANAAVTTANTSSPINTNSTNKTDTKSSKSTTPTADKKPDIKTTATKTISYATVQPLLQKYTCLACHNPNTKVIGPSYKEVASKKYSVAQIVQLIQQPNPSHWPGYATRMPSMAHVPKSDLTKIAQWIKSLEPAKNSTASKK